VRALRAPALLLAAFLAPRLAVGASAGPDPGLAGVPAGAGLPAEGRCIDCHASASMNPDTAGRIEILGLPERYQPGERYPLTLRLAHPDVSRSRWGFELTIVDAKTLRGAGELVVTDAVNTQRVDGGPGGRQYLEHTSECTAIGKAGEQRWSFAWIAPAKSVGDVAFFGGGNAANADGSKEGDWIYNPSPAPLATVRAPSN
jgi:hypothetical protein